MDNLKLIIPKLVGSANYFTWSRQMEFLFKSKKLFNKLTGESKESLSEDEDNEIMCILMCYVESAPLSLICNSANSVMAWKSLKDNFQRKSESRLFLLFSDLLNLSYDPSKGVQDLIDQIRLIQTELRFLKHEVHESFLISALLSRLPSDYESIKASIILVLTKLDFEEAAGRIKEREEVIKKQVTPTQVSNYGRFSSVTPSTSVANRSSNPSQFKLKRPCRHCKGDHYDHLCNRNNTSSYLLSVSDSSSTNSNWVIDSGCTFSCCSNRNMFLEFSSIFSTLNLGNGSSIQVLGIGKVELGNGVQIDAKYVPSLKFNLLSIRALTSQGLQVVFSEDQTCSIYDSDSLIQTIKIDENNLYSFHSIQSNSNLDFTIWHRRLGHLNSKDVRRLVKIPSTSKQLCEPCVLSKHLSTPFHSSSYHSKNVLECIHMDLVGELPQSKEGFKYVFVLVDDYSRYAYIYLLKSKDQAFDFYVRYVTEVENLHDRRVKRIRTDNGREFMNSHFDQFNQSKGIIHDHTTPYTPQSNGVVERFNRTLFEMTNSLLNDSQLPVEEFWTYAVHTAVQIRNCCPTSSLQNQIPYELWMKRKVQIKYFRIFGCVAYARETTREKIYPNSRKCIFVGYPDHVKGYRIYDPITEKVFNCRNVIFDESSLGSSLLEREEMSIPDAIISYVPTYFVYPSTQETRNINQENDLNTLDMNSQLRNNQESIQNDSNTLDVNSQLRNDQDFIQEETQEMDQFCTSPFSNCSSPNLDSDESTQMNLDSNESTQMNSHSNESTQMNSSIEKNSSIELINSTHTHSNEETLSSNLPLSSSTIPSTSHHSVDSSTLRRSARIQSRLAESGRDLVMNISETPTLFEPESYKHAMNTDDASDWKVACDEEMSSHQTANTWTLVPPVTNRKAIGCRWIFKYKKGPDGQIIKNKARLVAKGFTQKDGIDFDETFSPTAKFCSIRAMIAIAAKQNYLIHQMDVKTAYLNGDLDEEIFMKQPEGYVNQEHPDWYCKLNHSLYGLKQSGRCWYEKLHSTLLQMNFKRCEVDYCVYRLEENGQFIWLTVYVDDLLLISNNLDFLNQFKTRMSKTFSMSDLGEANFILGIEIIRENHLISLSQRNYITEIARKFNLLNAKPVSTPMIDSLIMTKQDCPTSQSDKEEMERIPYQSAIGSVMYCMLATRPDISYAITVLSRFSSNPGQVHWNALKRLIVYLYSTRNLCLTYGLQNSDDLLVGYCDANYAGCIDDRKSYTGYVYKLFGSVVSWQAKKQPTVALSTAESEYMAQGFASRESEWWYSILTFLGYHVPLPILIYSDSQSAIAIAKNPTSHSRTKHINVKYHYIRILIEEGKIELKYLPTEEQIADLFTKPLGTTRHKMLTSELGLRCMEKGRDC